jgi:hypothetical protein
MVAVFPSPRSSAMLGDRSNPAEFDGLKASTLAEPTDRRHQRRAVARLEALLQSPRPQDDNPPDFWTAIHAVMDVPASTSTWHEVMVAFGQEIQRIRQSQGLSLEQIRLKTQVPLYHLQSLESGQVDRLPEEIFVRGFLGRICAQLGPEGKALLAMLPATQAGPQALLAHWQQPIAAQETHLHLRSSHLYLGYATLLAGAAGGLALSLQVAEQPGQPGVAPAPVSQNATARAKFNPAQSIARMAFGSAMARPEQAMPELTP